MAKSVDSAGVRAVGLGPLLTNHTCDSYLLGVTFMANLPTGYLIPRLATGSGEPMPLLPTVRYTFGRAASCTMVLRDDLCSREHAELHFTAGNWYLRDIESLNGTFLNGNRLTTDQRLKPLDMIQIGNSKYHFIVKLEDLAGLSTEPPTPKAPEQVTIKSRLAETKYLPSDEQRAKHETGPLPHTGKVARESSQQAVSHLYRLAVDMAAAKDLKALAMLVLDGLLLATPADVVAILSLQPNREMSLEGYRTRNAKLTTYHKVSSFVSSEVLSTNAAVLAEDVAKNQSLNNRDSLAELQATSLVCAPMSFGKTVIGLLHLYCCSSKIRLHHDDLEYTLAVSRQLSIVWERLQREEGLTATVKTLADQALHDFEMVGSSQSLGKIQTMIARVADTKATVLVRGESGVGKELVARAVHRMSSRRNRPLICLNCAALTETLLESELFGHEKGAFTGATDRMIGKFESADRGTIFLDEIGEMSAGTQSKFLRVLEGQPFERVGGNTPITVDVRVVAATNRALEEAVRKGTFRRDLFFRLEVVQIEVPPLRDRPDDIPLLADYFLQRFNREMSRKLTGISPNAMQKLAAYRWPGNIRELRNVIERAVALCSKPQIEEGDIWHSSLELNLAEPESFAPKTLQEIEKQHIEQTLVYTDWNKSKASEILGIDRTTLDRKIKTYDLKKP